MSEKSESKSLFENSWVVYKKIMEADFMHHKAFARYLENELKNKSLNNSIKILDLGCGDGSPILPIIESYPISFYKGYDLSDFAIHLCEKNLQRLDVRYEMKIGDMISMIEKESETFDLIYSSYAIHHLSDEEKKILFQHISQRLNPSGKFVYIDVIREQEMTIQQYRAEYVDRIMNWHILDVSEKAKVIEHVTHYDFPAFSHDIEKWIEGASLKIERFEKGDDVHVFYSIGKK